MPEPVSVLNLSFDLPPAFTDQTDRYVFSASPWEFVQRMEIIPVPQLTDAGYLDRFQKWLETAYGYSDSPSTETTDDALVMTASISSEDPPVEVVAAVRDTPGLEFRFLASQDASFSWKDLYETIGSSDASMLGWTDDTASTYAVRGIDIQIPEDWQDTTDYVFAAGSGGPAPLTVRLKWEEEPGLSPSDRVEFLLAQVEASDPSSSIVEDEAIDIDGHDAHIGIWEGRATDTVLHEFIAIQTGEDRGAHLYASGAAEAFEAFGPSWNNLRQSLEIL